MASKRTYEGNKKDFVAKRKVRLHNLQIHEACKDNDTNRFMELIQAEEFYLDEITKNKTFHIAARTGNVTIVKELLKLGIDVNTLDNNHQSPLHIASKNGHLGLVKELLKSGANVDEEQFEFRTPIILASMKGHAEIVTELLKNGADTYCYDSSGQVAIHLAAENGHLEVVKVLLWNNDLDVKCLDNENIEPLQLASKNGHIEIVQELLLKGADIHHKDVYKQSAVHYVCGKETPSDQLAQQKYTDTLRTLVEFGADINLKNENEATPLHKATEIENVALVTELLNLGADINVQNNENETPLHIAADQLSDEIVSILINNGADVNLQNDMGYTPLHLLLFSYPTEGQRFVLEIIKMLLNADFNHNLKCNENETILESALENGNRRVVKTIIYQQTNQRNGIL